MNKNRMNLRLFDNDVNIIDRTGAESLIPIQESNEIIQGVIAQSAVLSRGRKLANMTSKQYKMPVLDMLPIAYFVNGDSGQKKTTKQAWDKKFIIAEEIAVIVPIPEAVLDDSQYDICGEVKPRVTEAFGNKVDGAVLLLLVVLLCQFFASDNHGSAGGSVQPAHHVKQGGLAATRGSHNSHKLAVLHGEIYAVKGAGNVRFCTVILFQVNRL